jgi:hypothetical protein
VVGTLSRLGAARDYAPHTQLAKRELRSLELDETAQFVFTVKVSF